MHRILLVLLVLMATLAVIPASAEIITPIKPPAGITREFRYDTLLWCVRYEPGKMAKTCMLRIYRPGKPDEEILIPPTCQSFASSTVFGRALQVYHYSAITSTRVRADSSGFSTSIEEPKKYVANVKHVKDIRIDHVDEDGNVRNWTPIDWVRQPKKFKAELIRTVIVTPAAPDSTTQ